MVGVPGRSKGCHLCRKRKIACTLEKPACYQCHKSNRQCPGYDRTTIFIVETKEQRQKRAKKPCHSVTPTANNENKDTPENLEQMDAVTVFDDYPTLKRSNSPTLKLWSGSESLKLAAYELQMFSKIVAKQTANNKVREHAGPGQGDWLVLVLQQTTLLPALRKSVQAFSAAAMARSVGVGDLMHHSIQLYTESLHELQKALRDPRQMYEDQILAACIMSVVYEFRHCPSQSRGGYKSHHDGCAKLIQARGPHAHVSGLGHALFVTFRVIGALQALWYRETFLVDKAWQTIPFSVEGKAPISQITDAILEGMDYLTRGEALRDMKDPCEEVIAAVSLLYDCRALKAKLVQFALDFQDTEPPLFWEVSANTPVLVNFEDSITPWQDRNIWFRDGTTAHVMTLYWALLIVTLSGICHLHFGILKLRVEHPSVISAASEAGYDLDNLPALGEDDDFRKVAHNVFRSFHYCVEGVSLDLGLSIVTAPLKMVFDVLEEWPHCSQEVKWAKAALDRVQELGIAMVRFL